MILARLYPRGSNMTRGARAADAFSSADIAHALSAVRGRLPGMVLQIKYVDRPEYTDLAIAELIRLFLRDKLAEREEIRQAHKVGAVAAAALDFHVQEPKCQTCKGAGEVDEKGLRKKCVDCGGSGRCIVTTSWLAASAGLSESAVARYWMKQFLLMGDILTSAESRGAREMKRALRRTP